MANAVKRNVQAPVRRIATGGRSARLTLVICMAVLAALVTQLPDPVQVLSVITGSGPSPVDAAAPLAAVQAILLITAGLIAWLLVTWALLVVAVGLLTRLPGRSGRRARRLLPRIAPASVGRVVAAAVGVSLIAGTAACAAPGGSTAAVGTPANTESPVPTTSPAADPADGSITIDWHAQASAAAGTTSSVGPTASPLSSAEATTTPSATSPTPAPTRTPTPEDSPVPTESSPSADPPQEPPPTAADPVAAEPTAADPVAAGPQASVTVQPGDSLWRIAEQSLGPDATESEVDNAWRAWYFVNRAVIGDDPDEIRPGQSLVAPVPGRPVDR